MQTRQATGKATLVPVTRTKGDKSYTYARGQIPIRLSNGKAGSRREERAFPDDCRTEKQREAQCAVWNAEYEHIFLTRDRREAMSFAEAAILYLKKGKRLPYYLDEINEQIGDVACGTISDETMVGLTEHLWPDDDVTAATVNRYLYTPVRAILRVALKERAPLLERPEGHKQGQERRVPPLTWYRTLVPTLNPNHQALIMFLAMHGRRLGEALSRKAQNLDAANGRLYLGVTKNGTERTVILHPDCLELILKMPDWQKRKWLFSAGPNSGNSLRRDLQAACDAVGLPWYSPHEFGRHFCVTRMLLDGYSVKHVADACGMTPEMVNRHYGHLAKTESTEALHETGGRLFETVYRGGSVGEMALPDFSRNAHSADTIGVSGLSAAPENSPSEGDALSICATGAVKT